MLCSSLIFTVGAEEAADSNLTSKAASAAEIVAAIKYDAEDNLFTGVALPTNTVNGWNGENAPQAHVVTDSKSGESYFHYFVDGEFVLKETGDDGKPITDGNEFINYNFTKVSLQKEDGKSEYIVLDYDMAYEKIAGTYKVGETQKNGWALASQVVHRNGSGSGLWGTGHNLASYAGKEMAHVTVVYDYTTNSSYIFVDGVIHSKYANAMSAAGYETYLAGETVVSSEFKIGSNSYDNYKLDNMYVRHIKAADAENTLDDAIKAGDITKWDGNVYVGFVPSVAHTDVAIESIKDINSGVIATTEGNIVSGSSFTNHHPIYSVANSVAGSDAYATVYANADGSVEKKNPGLWFTIDTGKVDKLSVAEGSTAFYVIDLDMSTNGDVLPYIDISPALRRVSDTGGWPFGTSVKAGQYLTSGEWTHITIVGDIANNVLHVFVNGEYKAVSDTVAYKVSELTDPKTQEVNTEIVPQSIRIEFSISSNTTDYLKGMNITIDNICERTYTSADLSGGLAEAVAAKNISSWSGNIVGKAGEKLPTIAVVNGTECGSVDEINAAIIANKSKGIELEFMSAPIAPINFKAEGTINTNGMPIESLVKFDEACSNPIVDGNLYTVTLGWSINYAIKEVTSGTVLDHSQVKYEHSGNILSSINLYNYHNDDERHVSFITNLDTGDVFVNDFPVGNISTASNTYIQIAPAGNKLVYKKGVGQNIVFDFDMAVYDRESEQAAPLNIISRYPTSTGNAGAWGNSSRNVSALFKDVPLGQFAHVTIIVSVDSRMGYYFINNELVYADENIITEQAQWLEALRCFGNSTSDILYDNVCIRDISNAEIETIAAAGDLSKWSSAIYGADYRLPVAPTVATVDGVLYGSVEAVNNALATDDEVAKVVEIKHIPFKGEERTFKIRTAAEVNTNGLDVSLDWNTGIYEFDPNNELYVSTETGLAYASSKLIHTSVDNTHYFTTIDASNCFQTATPVNWYYDSEYENYDVVFYVYGDTIAPLEFNAYVEDGVYFQDQWQEFTVEDGIPVMGDIVEEYPVSSATTGEKNFLYDLVTKEVDFIVTDIKLGAVVNSNIELTVYVNRYETLTTGDVVVLDGVEYVALRFELAPHEIDKMVEATFIITDDEGNEYPQLQRVSFLDYAEDVLSGDYTDADKKVVANLLAYANEASVLFIGEKIAEVTALLETYASYVESAELPEKVDTSDLKSVIRSAALRLNGTPEFVFKVARGFKGTITFTYQGVTGEVKVSRTVDATKSEQLVSLPVDVCDLQADITITAGEVSGIYNLATYAQSLENNDFAVALYNYSAAAKAHKQGLVFVYVITGYDDNNKPITKIYGEYTPGSKIDIPFLHDGLAITWYLGYGEDKEEIDINNYVITESITLSYTEVVNVTPLETVTDKTLESINKSLLKNFDSCNYVTAVKDGEPAEAILLTRNTAWPESTDINAFWTEQVYTLDSSRKVVSISFDYLVLGEVGNHQAPSGESYSQGIFQVKYTDTVVAEQGLIDAYNIVNYGSSVLVEDGAWHTFTYKASKTLEMDSFILKVYKLIGDILITNIDVEYAPLETYNEDGSLNTTVVLKENVESETLTTIVESKIKQLDQAKLAGTDDAVNDAGYFEKEGGTAAYVLGVKDGEYVEALYFNRTKDWTTHDLSTQNSGFSEIRFALDTTKTVESISFDYIINGTVIAGNNGEGVFQVRKTDDAYVDIDEGADTYLEDGEWHTYTWENADELALKNFLFKLSQFNGEFLISNIVITYAE